MRAAVHVRGWLEQPVECILILGVVLEGAKVTIRAALGLHREFEQGQRLHIDERRIGADGVQERGLLKVLA